MAKTLLEYDSNDEYEFILDEMDIELKKTSIKNAFLEIKNGGWRKQRGITKNFPLNAKNVFNKLVCGDSSFKMLKDGQKIIFIRYSHDEPTGATILLHSIKHRERIHKKIFG